MNFRTGGVMPPAPDDHSEGMANLGTRDSKPLRIAKPKPSIESQLFHLMDEANLCVVLGDRNRTITYLNRCARERLTSSVVVAGEPLYAAYSEVGTDPAVPNEIQHSIQLAIQDALEAGIPALVSSVPAGNREFELNVYPTSEGVALLFRDVTESRRAENMLKRSEERFRRLTLSLSTLAWTAAGDGSLCEGVAEWLEFTGQTADELREFGWLDAVHPDDRRKTVSAWSMSDPHRNPIDLCHRVRRKDGSYRLMHMHAVALLDDIGALKEWAGVHRDFTDREAVKAQLRHAHDRFLLATRATTDGIWEIDGYSGRAYYSARWRAIVGLPEEEAYGTIEDWFARVHPSDLERCRGLWDEIRETSKPLLEFEFRSHHEDGSWRWILVRAICQVDSDGQLFRLTGSIRDISTKKVTDPLTGLHNRTSLLEQLQWRIDRASEYSRGYCLMFLDLDSFKRINDSLGHLKGDAVLVEVASRLDMTVKATPGCLASRLGGDEFVVLLDDVATKEDALTYAGAIEYSLRRPVDCQGQKIFVSASIGMAFGAAGTYTRAENVLEDADLAMYHAKLNGKARNAIFSEDMRKKAVLRLQLESDLRVALEEGQFELHYQPKVDVLTREVKGFEALVRWRSPERGLVPPCDFIAAAEEMGFIGELGRWTMATAIEQLGEWRRKGIVDSSTTMAVNLSTKQLVEADLLKFLQEQLQHADLPTACLVLEITESLLVEDSPTAIALLESIVNTGIGLDLDDFGTGYSSLSYLHRFPFCSVKIDRSFVGRMEQSAESVNLVSSIVNLAGSLKMGVVAEGVETEEQAGHLVAMGCKLAQGYLFAKPMPASQVEKMVLRGWQPEDCHAPIASSPEVPS
ncbi:MAG TPA: EAL domain-containing protein [Acidobacteriaceae bacterium]